MLIDAREPNENGLMVDIVLRHVVNIGRLGQQGGTIVEIHANDNRSRFGRAVSWYTGQNLSRTLRAGNL